MLEYETALSQLVPLKVVKNIANILFSVVWYKTTSITDTQTNMGGLGHKAKGPAIDSMESSWDCGRI